MQYDFTLPANGGTVIEVKGKFFKYKNGTGAIRVKTDHGGYVDLLPGQGVWNTDYSKLVIQDRSGLANGGVILAGDFDFHDDRISGSVEVIDGGKNRTKQGVAFSQMGFQGGTAGLISCVQLWNPAGSGVNVVLENTVFGTDQSSQVFARRTSAALLTTYGTSGGNKQIVPGAQVVSKAQMRVDQPAYTTQPGDLSFLMFGILAVANTPFSYKTAEPFVITPGAGIVLIGYGPSGQGGNNLLVTFEWYEDLI